MNILLESRSFYPSVGGLEMMSEELAREWQSREHVVRVLTVTPLDGNDELSDLEVVRQPSARQVWEQARWCDVYVQSGISLKGLWPALVARRPIVFIHHNMLVSNPDGDGWREQVKQLATQLGRNIAVSEAVADDIGAPATVIPNTFRPAFKSTASNVQERSGILFVGRLVSNKGADIAIDALKRLHEIGHPITLTLCGDGPDRDRLEEHVSNYGLIDHVHFAGWTDPESLACYYSQARATLVPSRYEPFGIVALEAIACGAPVVAARTGGLPEAVGPCGLLVPPEDPDALARAIEQVLDPAVRSQLMKRAPDHLATHRIDRIADRYLDVLQDAVE